MPDALHALAIHRASIVVPTKILQLHPSLPIHQPSPLARWLRRDSTCLPTHSSLGRNSLSRSSLGRSCGARTQGRLAPRLAGSRSPACGERRETGAEAKALSEEELRPQLVGDLEAGGQGPRAALRRVWLGADHQRVGSDARRVLRPKLSRKKSFGLSLWGISLTSMATCLPLSTAPWTRPGTVRDMCSPAKKSTSA